MRIFRTWIWGIVLAVAIAGIYWTSLGFGFLNDWDDSSFVLSNPHISFNIRNLLYYFTHPFQDLYTPLPMLSLMFDHAIFGAHAFGYHLHNLLLHIGGAIVLWWIFRRLGVRDSLATLAVLLWALNPQKVESVIWISERKDVLCGVLAFLSMLFFLQERPRWAGALAFLAILAKPAAIALPGIFIVLAILEPPASWRQKLLWPVAGGAAGILLSTVMTLQTNPGSLESSFLVPLHNLFWYPLTALAPFECNPIYPESVPMESRLVIVLGCGLLMAALGVMAARKLDFPWRAVFCTLLIIAGTALPVLGLLHYTNFRYCDRYNYLISAVVLAAMALLAERLLSRYPNRPLKHALIGLGLAGALVFAWLTWNYLPYWENCQYLSYYCLHQPGVPNKKAYDMGVNSALKNESLDYLDYLHKQLLNRPPLLENDIGQVDNLLLFLSAHLAMRAGDFDSAQSSYASLQRHAITEGRLFMAMPEAFVPVMYYDLEYLARLHGDTGQADFYHQQLEQLKTKN